MPRRRLGEIRQQTDSLQRLGGRMLGRLTRAVTEGRPEHEQRQMLLLIEAIRTVVPTNAVPQTQPTFTPDERAWLFQLCAGTYFYAAVTNVFCQDLLPASTADIAPELRRIVDMSNSDVVIIEGWLQPAADCPQGALDLHRWATLWRPVVRDTLGAYQAREQGTQTATAAAE